MIEAFSATAGLGLLLFTLAQTPAPPITACSRCGWRPSAGPTLVASSVAALERALSTARAGDTILLDNGQYPLQRTIDIRTPSLTIRGLSGDPAKVVLHGAGMVNDHVGVALSISAPDVTIADVTIRDVGFHAVQVRGEQSASGFMSAQRGPPRHRTAAAQGEPLGQRPSRRTRCGRLLGVQLYHTRSQRLHERGRHPGHGGMDHPRQSVHEDSRPGAHSLERRTHNPGLVGAEDTIVERNVIVDSFRGIALGLGPTDPSPRRREYDHLRGVIRDNTIVNLNAWADEAIEANGARDARIERNTVIVEGAVSWSIAVRFPTASAVVTGNLTTRQVLERDGGHAVVENHTTIETARKPSPE